MKKNLSQKTNIINRVIIGILIFIITNIYISIPSFCVHAAQKNIITASEFVSQMNTGWNLGNSLDSHYGDPTGDGNLSQETIWGNPKITKEQIDLVKNSGFDVIRVPISWYTHTYRDENGTIHIHRDWMNRVKEVVDYCISDGLYVIINTHHDGKIIHAGVTDSSFAQIEADAASIWSEIATYFAAYDQHLIFESYNEVDNYEKYWSFGQRAAFQMNELNQIFVDTVRSCGSNNQKRLLMVPTLLDQTGDNTLNAFVLPNDSSENLLLVTVHKYSQQFDQSVDAVFSDLETFSNKIGAPVIIGEWGTKSDYSPANYRTVHASNYIYRANAHGLKCIYWDNGSNYAIIDRKNLSVNTEMISAIMNPSPYTSDSSVTISNWNDYKYMTIDHDTGELKEDKHWGSIVINTNKKGGHDIPSDKTNMYIGLICHDNMSEHRIHYIYFFDENNKLLSTINSWNGFTEKNIDIPSGTSYIRIDINSAHSATSEEQYKKAVENGNLALVIHY